MTARGLQGVPDGARVVDTSPEAREAMEARRDELGKLTKADLIALHSTHLVGRPVDVDPRPWHKDLLVRAVLEDEGHLWHPETCGPE